MAKIIYFSLVAVCSAVDYFPKGYFNSSDVTLVSWAHAVNSKALLAAAIANKSINMLEADLSIGRVEGGDPSETAEVIMAHPPTNSSDLSFEAFLNATIEHNRNLSLQERKGIKLDFKSTQAAILAIPDLADKRREYPELMNFPIWINADVLSGPVNASEPGVKGEELIPYQKEHSPESTLSIGWTTRFGKQSDGSILSNGSYTQQNVEEMASLIKKEFTNSDNTSVEITFPLRAGLAINSVESIKWLLFSSGINFTRPSVTLWEGSDDPPLEPKVLASFIKEISPCRVFVDLPYSRSQITTGAASFQTVNVVSIVILVISVFIF